MDKVVGVEVNAIDRVEGSQLCPDDPADPDGPPPQFAVAQVSFLIKDMNDNTLSNGVPHRVVCVQGEEAPVKGEVRFTAASCGPPTEEYPDGGFQVGVWDIFTSVDGTAGELSRTQKLRGRP
jgi:hypothetical protein